MHTVCMTSLRAREISKTSAGVDGVSLRIVSSNEKPYLVTTKPEIRLWLSQPGEEYAKPGSGSKYVTNELTIALLKSHDFSMPSEHIRKTCR
jgi:hypothetical protein